MTHPASPDIALRLERWSKTGDPSDLWPNVRPDRLAAAHREITSVTGAVLGGNTPTPQLQVPYPHDQEAIGVAAFVSGMGALLGYWIDHGLVAAPPGIAGVLATHLRHGQLRAQRLHGEFVRILRQFNNHGLTPVVLKGMYTSRIYFPEPGVRPLGDIDLLVTPAQRHKAEASLRAAGFVVHRKQIAEQTEWRLAAAPNQVQSLELDHASNPWTVDLHTSIDTRYFRGLWARFGDLPHTHVSRWDVDGYTATVFTQPLLTAHLAQHATRYIHLLRLVRLVELILVIRRDTAVGTLSWDALARLLADTKTARFVYPALELAERLVPGTIHADLLRELAVGITPRMRRVVDRIAVSGMHMAGRGTVGERFVWARGAREVTKNFTDLIWPPARSASERWKKYGKWARMVVRGRLAMRS